MRKNKKIYLLTITVIVAALVFALPAFASVGYEGYLDTHVGTQTGYAGPVTTGTLDAGQAYLVTVDGTFSVWNASQWSSYCLGNPENGPTYPSSGTTNGKVGLDAAYVFALAHNSTACYSHTESDIPYTHGHFVYGIDGGGYTTLTPINDYNSSHTYQYLILGTDDPVNFAFAFQDNPITDNYGRLHITVETVDAGAFTTGGGSIVDVNGGDATFGFTARNKNGDVKGSLEYQDHSGLNLHSNSIDAVYVFGDTAYVFGTADEGQFTLVVTDSGEPGAGVDTFKLTLDGNLLANGYISQGNIQVHNK